MSRKARFLSLFFVAVLFFWAQGALPCSAKEQTQPPPAPVLKDIPVRIIHVKGSHYEAGFQIGTQLKGDILRDVAEMKKSPDWKKVRAEAELFLAYSKKYLPEYVTEIKGAADAVGVELEDLFPGLCENSATRTTGSPRNAATSSPRTTSPPTAPCWPPTTTTLLLPPRNLSSSSITRWTESRR